MVINTLMTIVFVLTLFGSAFGNDINEIKWITENYPPFNYVDDEGELRGVTIDILMEIWEKVGLKKTKKDIEVLPWARGMLILKNDDTTCLFGMGINESRKKKFIFVGSIPNVNRGIIAKKSKNYSFNSLSEINSGFGDSKIGVVRDDIGQIVFLEQGGNPRLLYQVVSGENLVLMLKLDRIEAIVYGDIPAYKLMKKVKIDYAAYEMFYVFSKGVSGYAFNKKTDPEIIRKLQQAYDELYRDGIVMRISYRKFGQ